MACARRGAAAETLLFAILATSTAATLLVAAQEDADPDPTCQGKTPCSPFGGNNVKTGQTCNVWDCSHDRPLALGQIFCSTVQHECRWCPCSGHGSCCDGSSHGCTLATDTPSPSLCTCDPNYSGEDCSTYCDPVTGKCGSINTNQCHLPPKDSTDKCTVPGDPAVVAPYDTCSECTNVKDLDCVWCPGCPGDKNNAPRCVSNKGDDSCGFAPSSITLFAINTDKKPTCASQCTENTCPANSICTDDPTGEALCTCAPGYFAPPVAHGLPTQCIADPTPGGQVAHVCQDYGDPNDVTCNDPNSPTCIYSKSYDTEAACKTMMSKFDNSVNDKGHKCYYPKIHARSTLEQLLTWCPKACGLCSSELLHLAGPRNFSCLLYPRCVELTMDTHTRFRAFTVLRFYGDKLCVSHPWSRSSGP
jgi:hypothetical protein